MEFMIITITVTTITVMTITLSYSRHCFGS